MFSLTFGVILNQALIRFMILVSMPVLCKIKNVMDVHISNLKISLKI